MKKVFLGVFLITTIMFNCFFFLVKEKTPKISNLLLANIEALARTESPSGTCGSTGWTGDSWMTVCNVSKEEAMENFNWWDTPYKWWCCDSCESTSYCGSGGEG